MNEYNYDDVMNYMFNEMIDEANEAFNTVCFTQKSSEEVIYEY